jgi:hypothetical protein
MVESDVTATRNELFTDTSLTRGLLTAPAPINYKFERVFQSHTSIAWKEDKVYNLDDDEVNTVCTMAFRRRL